MEKGRGCRMTRRLGLGRRGRGIWTRTFGLGRRGCASLHDDEDSAAAAWKLHHHHHLQYTAACTCHVAPRRGCRLAGPWPCREHVSTPLVRAGACARQVPVPARTPSDASPPQPDAGTWLAACAFQGNPAVRVGSPRPPPAQPARMYRYLAHRPLPLLMAPAPLLSRPPSPPPPPPKMLAAAHNLQPPTVVWPPSPSLLALARAQVSLFPRARS